MGPDRRRCRQSARRARLEEAAACARDRDERLAAGAEAAAAWERALLGALLVRPRVIRAFARSHPPDWFVDDGALAIMRGLFCASAGDRKMTVDDLIDSLERHDALAIVGGPDAIRSLAAPRPALDDALRELDGLLERLPAEEQEQVARDEDLDDLPDLIAGGVNSAVAPQMIDEPPVPVDDQLMLFEEGPQDRVEAAAVGSHE